jgi:hypothetical protein
MENGKFIIYLLPINSNLKQKRSFNFFVERPLIKFMYLLLKVFQHTNTANTAAKPV